MSRSPLVDLANRLPVQSGTYALIYSCEQKGTVQIGKLGNLKLCPGYYVYIGSAFGPGGIRARISHHLQVATNPHWHIDYLKAFCCLRELWMELADVHNEQKWAESVALHPNARVPLKGFGATDAKSASHLFHFPKRPTTTVLGPERDPHIVPLSSG